MRRLFRLFRTLRHLRGRQLWYQVSYRLWRGLDRPGQSYDLTLKEELLEQTQRFVSVKESPTRGSTNKTSQIAPASLSGQACFCFLNRNQDFGSSANIDWNFATYGKLWTYNLNYFEFLRQPETDPVTGQELIDDWIAKSPQLKDAWEPYPTSLRIVHWLGFYAHFNLPVPHQVGHSLYSQYRSLWHKLEYHLQANHLLENAIALCLAAYFFRDEKRWLKATELLQNQLEEQYRPEGAHYELSPMYHTILLWRQLKLYAWIGHGELILKGQAALRERLHKTINKQLAWLDYLTDDSGQYPHFNDSTAGIAPAVMDLLHYAQSQGFTTQRGLSAAAYEDDWVAAPASLHRRWQDADLWVDLGPLGPDHQPGHGHADNLTFCLSRDGRPIIVDPSVSTYENNNRRATERSTAYHNTICLPGQNSAEIWGAFRCGRRPKTEVYQITSTEIVAQHSGYGRPHHRHVQLGEVTLSIIDRIKGSARAHLHFSPEIALSATAAGFEADGYTFRFSREATARIETYECAIGFNRLVNAQRLSIDFADELTTYIEAV